MMGVASTSLLDVGMLEPCDVTIDIADTSDSTRS